MTRALGDGRLRHRGPDWSGLFVDEKCGCYLAHERLAIIDPTSGDQPLFNEAKDIVVAVSLLLTHARVGVLLHCCLFVLLTVQKLRPGLVLKDFVLVWSLTGFRLLSMFLPLSLTSLEAGMAG